MKIFIVTICTVVHLCFIGALSANTTDMIDSDIQKSTLLKEQVELILKNSNDLESVDYSIEGATIYVTADALSLDAETKLEERLLSIEGIEYVESSIRQTFDFSARFAPVIDRLESSVYDFLALVPMMVIALGLIFLGLFLAKILGNQKSFYMRFTNNTFLQDIIRQSVKAIIIVLSVISALELIGATSIIGAVLGAAGVFGLAISFAFKDVIENYIAGILLSLRQPFSSGDHVKIGDFEGLIIRMTTRATMIKSFDGNNIEIPNASVFKQAIVNYHVIPERRFDFSIGIDAEADPDVGRKIGIRAIANLPGVLDKPKVLATTDAIGDSSIILSFFGWVDQNKNDFFQVRSSAIRAAKEAIESAGVAIPEPMYAIKMIDAHQSSRKAELVQNSHQSELTKPIPDENGDELSVERLAEVEDLLKREKLASDPNADLLQQREN